MKYVSGDLFQSGADCLVNPVNCRGVMGAGLAKAFREKYPAIMRPYVTACRQAALRPGKIQILQLDRTTGALSPTGDLFIANVPTKDDWRGQSQIGWIDEGLRKLAGALPERGIRSIAIPKLGAGLGGLPWPQVREVVEKHFAPLAEKGIAVLVYGESREQDRATPAAPGPAPARAASGEALKPAAVRTDIDPVPLRERDVLEFRGADRIGSNMHPSPVLWGDELTPARLWKCNEIPYVLAKTVDPAARARLLKAYEEIEGLRPHDPKDPTSYPPQPGSSPYVLKKLGRDVPLRPDWEEIKVPLMQSLVDDKFRRNPECTKWLLGTGRGLIQEGNKWGDTFWGVSLIDNPRRGIRAGEGRNELGKCLMRAREAIREELATARGVSRDARFASGRRTRDDFAR